MPEWEEMMATACAVQNMYIQATKFDDLGCYWSSWKEEWKNSDDCKEFLNMDEGDRCLGVFVIGHLDSDLRLEDRRVRRPAQDSVEWRLDNGEKAIPNPF